MNGSTVIAIDELKIGPLPLNSLALTTGQNAVSLSNLLGD
jgi:hypothetical protein